MKRVLSAIWLAALVLAGLSAGAVAQTSPSLAEALKLRDTANDIVGKGKLTDVRPIVPDLRRALDKPDLPAEIDGNPTVFVDGPRELRAFRAWQADPNGKDKTKDGKTPIAVDDPYPLIAHVLGLYLNETDHPDEALVVLAKGFEILREHHVPEMAATTPPLMMEMAATFNAAKQSATALKAYDYVLTLPSNGFDLRAKAQRGRGYALIELNRLDEAEAAYNESLKLEPGNGLALRELRYIADARAGQAKSEAPSMILTPNTKTPAQK